LRAQAVALSRLGEKARVLAMRGPIPDHESLLSFIVMLLYYSRLPILFERTEPEFSSPFHLLSSSRRLRSRSAKSPAPE
jgi:hypothetical protein